MKYRKAIASTMGINLFEDEAPSSGGILIYQIGQFGVLASLVRLRANKRKITTAQQQDNNC